MRKDGIRFRVSDKELNIIQKKRKKANMSISEYCRKMTIYGRVLVIENMDSILYELRKIGNNINQMTLLSYQGKIKITNLDNTNKRLADIYKSLIDLKKD